VFVCWLRLTHADGSATHQDDAVSFLQMGLTTANDETTADSKLGMLATINNAISTDVAQSDGGRHLRRRQVVEQCREKVGNGYCKKEGGSGREAADGTFSPGGLGSTTLDPGDNTTNDCEALCRRTMGCLGFNVAPTAHQKCNLFWEAPDGTQNADTKGNLLWECYKLKLCFTYKITMATTSDCSEMIDWLDPPLVDQEFTKPIGVCTTNALGQQIVFACSNDTIIQEISYEGDDCSNAGSNAEISRMDIHQGCNYVGIGFNMTWEGWCTVR